MGQRASSLGCRGGRGQDLGRWQACLARVASSYHLFLSLSFFHWALPLLPPSGPLAMGLPTCAERRPLSAV